VLRVWGKRIGADSLLVVGVIALPVSVPLLLNVLRNVEELDYRRLRSVWG
jgi:hypothetical protein